MTGARVRFGGLWVDAVTSAEALSRIEELVDARHGGSVFTPNVDHVVLAESDPVFRDAYARTELSLCDGQPLRWASRLLGVPLAERVSGADLFVPIMRLAARRRFRVYLFGGGPGVAEESAHRLSAELGVHVVGTGSPLVGLRPGPDEDAHVAEIAAARPDLVVVLLGAPKGELWIDRVRERLAPAVALQLGASADFFLGRIRRAPRWMQRAGVEWLFRLLQEPRRLAHRYLVRDVRFVAILARTLLDRRAPRALPPGAVRPAAPAIGDEPRLREGAADDRRAG